MRVGLDRLAVCVPRHYLELEDLARARGVPPEKYRDGLGVRRMAMPTPFEDTTTLAANAADRLLKHAGLAPAEVGMVIVGTETGVDHAKPVATFVHGLLGLSTDCRVYEIKHACYGATAGIQAASDWIRAGSARGRKALVIASDIARYELGSAGEPTQGAGAVAMVVAENPRMVEFEEGMSGVFSRDVHDFWRPLYRKEAAVDGKYSVDCYLEALEGAFGRWKAVADGAAPLALAEGEVLSDRFARLAYHVPFGKMAQKAHARLLTLDWQSNPARWKRVEHDLPRSIAEDYERRVALSVDCVQEVGNLYSGSLYMGIAGLLEREGARIEGKRLGLFSYGSGNCAEFFSARVVEGAAAGASAVGFRAQVDDRVRLDVAAYERILEERSEMDTQPKRSPPADTLRPGEFAYLGVDKDQRFYVRV